MILVALKVEYLSSSQWSNLWTGVFCQAFPMFLLIICQFSESKLNQHKIVKDLSLFFLFTILAPLGSTLMMLVPSYSGGGKYILQLNTTSNIWTQVSLVYTQVRFFITYILNKVCGFDYILNKFQLCFEYILIIFLFYFDLSQEL